MHDIEIIRIIVTVGGVIGLLTIAGAVARRIAGPYSRRFRARQLMGLDGGVDSAEHEALREEVARLREELDAVQARVADIDELQNRMDFTERLLAQAKTQGKLPAGGDER